MESAIALALAVALLVAVLFAWLGWRRPVATEEQTRELAELRASKADLEIRSAAASVRAERVRDLEEKERTLNEELSRAQFDNSSLKADLADKVATVRANIETISELRTRLTKAEGERDENAGRVDLLQRDVKRLEVTNAALNETLEQEREHSKERLSLLQSAREEMTKEFKLLAGDVMKQNSETFSQQNRDQIEGILTPLREKLTEFRTELDSAHKDTIVERATLAEQIRTLAVASADMKSETVALTRALKGEAHTQGAWGEMVLTSIMEKSGLREGSEYYSQSSYTKDDGQVIRPDVVVKLPAEQSIVIDAKVSLTAFEKYVNAESPEVRAAEMQRHLLSLRTHIRTLGSKGYEVHTGGGVNYVIMFVPIEGALAAALQEAPELTSEALAANVAIATPTTLMIALRTAASVWQVERRNRNAEDIASRAGYLYEKFAGFGKDLLDLGGHLNATQKSYSDALSKLTTGQGNLLRQVEMLKTLGAKTNKSMPQKLLEGNDTSASILAELPNTPVTLVANQ